MGTKWARCQDGKLYPPGVEEEAAADVQRVGSLADKSCEGRIDLAAAAGLDDPDLQPHGTSSRFHVSQYRFGAQAISRIDKHGNASCSGHQLAQEFKPLCHQLVIENIETCQIAARPGKAGNKTKLDRVFGRDEDDGDCRRCRLSGEHGTCERGDHGDLSANQFGRQQRQPIYLALGPAVVDRHVLALDIAGVFEALAECPQTVRVRVVKRCGVEEPDDRHHRLLRARRERPRRC